MDEEVDEMARALLAACVELRKEAALIEPEEARHRDEVAKFRALEGILRGTPYPEAIEKRLREIANGHGEEFGAWLGDLFERGRAPGT